MNNTVRKLITLVISVTMVICTLPAFTAKASEESVKVISTTNIVASLAKITNSEKESLKGKVRSKGTIKDVVYRDFDNDGKYEAVIGLRTKNSKYNGMNQGDKAIDSLWYVDDNKVKNLSSKVLFFKDTLRAAKVKKGYVIIYQCDFDAVNSYTYQWFIDSYGNVRKLPKIMGYLEYEGKNKFSTYIEDGDMNSFGGLTWKRYDLFWNGKQLCEYGAWQIPEDVFENYKGGKSILKKIKKEYPNGWIGSIYQRENGAINVNFEIHDYSKVSSYTEYYNVTVKLVNNRVKYYVNYQGKNKYAKSSFEKALYYGSYEKSAGIKGIKMVYSKQKTVTIPDPVFVESDIIPDSDAKYDYTPLVPHSIKNSWPVYGIGFESNGDDIYYHMDGEVIGRDDKYIYLNTRINQNGHFERAVLKDLNMKLGDIAIWDGKKYIVSSLNKDGTPRSLTGADDSLFMFFGDDILPDLYCNISSYMGFDGGVNKKLVVRIHRDASVRISTYDGENYDTTADKFFTEWNKKDKKAENYQHASGYRWDVYRVDETGSIDSFGVIAAD